MKRFVVCYDISSNSARNKVSKRLKNKGFRSQLSFFEVSSSSHEEVSSDVKGLLAGSDRLAVVRVSKKGEIKRIGSLFEGMEWVL